MGELARLKIDFCCKDNLDKRSQSHAMVGFDFSPFGLKQHMAEMWKTRLRFVMPSWLAKTAKITGTVWEKWRIVCLAIHGKFEFQNICELQTKDNLNWLKKFKDQIGPRRHNTGEIWKRHFLLWKRIKCFRPHYSVILDSCLNFKLFGGIYSSFSLLGLHQRCARETLDWSIGKRFA